MFGLVANNQVQVPIWEVLQRPVAPNTTPAVCVHGHTDLSLYTCKSPLTLSLTNSPEHKCMRPSKPKYRCPNLRTYALTLHAVPCPPQSFLQEFTLSLLGEAFPHASREGIVAFVNGLMNTSLSEEQHKTHVRDFLITLKVRRCKPTLF